eukprot:TRINITY_DN93_c2_g1_i1.p3 TRINITY_DN93_c2_g1~~TRINITY_DN93_c2_g1_i1.p3  ORF type:complete len:111 (+),score=26.16 TRINITY_DN93_c2_g1_i1:158-490(+)
MGCCSSYEVPEPATPVPQRHAPPPPTAEELERRRAEEEERKIWEERAAACAPPAPFPKPELMPGSNDDQYKEYMRRKYEYEAWENSIVLLARKMRREAAELVSRAAMVES